MNVTMIPDVLRHPRSFWIDRLGKRGAILHDRAQGIDHAQVCPDSEAKSCSAENTFDADTQDRRELSVGYCVRPNGWDENCAAWARRAAASPPQAN